MDGNAQRECALSIGAGEPTTSRRALVAGVGAVVAGLQIGAPAVAGQGPAFDIRTLVEDSELDDATIQCTYDAINRTVILVGDLPFTTLLGQPMSGLMPPLQPRVDTAAAAGLMANPGAVHSLFSQLQTNAATATIADFFVKARSGIDPSVMTTLISLRRNGVRIPLPVGTTKESRARAGVIKKLLKDAPELTFLGLFTESHDTLSSKSVSAVANARANGLFSWWDNDRCCDHGGGDANGATDACVPYTDKWCNLTGQGQAFCSIGSDTCPGDHEGRRG